MVGFNFPPRGWAFCDGQLLSIASNTAVFSLLGTTYGGDGRTTFALPDLRGRVAVHPGTGSGLLAVQWGELAGRPSVTLTAAHLPSHTHTATTTVNAIATAKALAANGGTDTPTGAVWAKNPRENNYSSSAPTVDMRPGIIDVSASAATTVGNTGSNQPFSNMQPYLGIYHVICLEGIFPPRN